MHDRLAYVLNARGSGSVRGFRLVGARLVPIFGSERALGLVDTTPPEVRTSPRQVGFSPDGSRLVVTTKTGGTLSEVFDVRWSGHLRTPVATASVTPIPSRSASTRPDAWSSLRATARLAAPADGRPPMGAGPAVGGPRWGSGPAGGPRHENQDLFTPVSDRAQRESPEHMTRMEVSLMTKLATRLAQAPAATTLPAADLERARRFYEEQLGLDVDSRADMPGSLFVHAGNGSLIVIYDRGRGGDSDATSVTFEVDDLAATLDELRAHGIVLEEYDLPGLRTVNGIASRDADLAAWFKDSEGNILCAHQTLS